MILPFSTQMNGKQNYFVERIWEGLLRNIFKDDTEYQQYFDSHKNRFGKYWDWFPDEHTRLENPKIHTIREDKNDRWQVGKKIDFFINCRQKDMFRFAPVLPVVSVQKVEIVYDKIFGKNLFPDVLIDNVRLHPMKLDELARNDGFDTIEDFFAYFNEDFTGKIIHWTDLRY